MVLSPTMVSTETPASSSQHQKHEGRPVNPSRPSKRLTLSFPILLPTSQPDRHQSPSPNHTTPADSIRNSPRLHMIAASPTDSNTFLTSLAAQERHVLELREELQKAESDLSLLKRQWAQHEAGKKKDELRHIERLQSLPITHPAVMDGHVENGGTPAAVLRASLESGTDRPVVRKSTQRVFAGSRHTRALSLLSPGAMTNSSTQSGPFEEALSPRVTATDIHSKHPPLSRSSTRVSAEQSIGFGLTYKRLAERRSMQPPAKDVIVNSGKKMASDLREGLWTFFEDIRQATVGEEGINGVETRTVGTGRMRRQGPKRLHESEQSRIRAKNRDQVEEERQKEAATSITRSNTETPPPGVKNDKSFWKEFGLETTSSKNADIVPTCEQPKPGLDTSLVDIDDSWDLWDSSVLPHPLPNCSCVATDEKNQPDNKGLPCPELTKATPSRLSRTVLDMMKDWDSPAVASRSSPAGLDDQAVASPHI